jgi:hypothetical protein
LHGIQEYFDRSGASSVGVSTLEEASSAAPRPDAAVIFADGIPEDALARAASELPVKLVVVVTREVERIREVLWARRAQARVLVLPRLAWGWTLVEVVRRSLPEPSRLALR